MPATLSVAIITLNEEQSLARTLASVAFADEVVVVDSGSTDRTLAIAAGFSNVRVLHREWTGFASQKNFALAQCTGDWLLSLDADEELSTELQCAVKATLLEAAETSAYFLRRRNYFLGRWMKHGGFYPDAKLRLFRRGLGLQFEERAVHESIPLHQLKGTPARALDGDLRHDAYPTLTAYIEHMDRYSTLGAQVLTARGRTSASIFSFAWNVFFVPQWQFQWNYFMRGGFRDGREGLLLHLYQAVYASWKYAKAWEGTRTKR